MSALRDGRLYVTFGEYEEIYRRLELLAFADPAWTDEQRQRIRVPGTGLTVTQYESDLRSWFATRHGIATPVQGGPVRITVVGALPQPESWSTVEAPCQQ